MGRTVYMKVTTDKYELPVGVADSVAELSKLTGKSANNISSMLSHAKKNGCKSQIVEVEIDDEGEENE